MSNMSKNRFYFPIAFLLSWLALTILSFAFGPYFYKLTKPFIFYSYLFLIHAALFLGYFLGQRKEGHATRVNIYYYRIVEVTIIISIIYLIVKLIITGGGDIRNLIVTFRNAQETYAISSLKHSNLFSYFDILFFPLSVIAITNAIYCHNKLRLPYRISVYLMILVSIASSIGSATRAGIMELFILVFAALLLSIYQKNFIVRMYHKILVPFIILITIGGFFVYSNVLIYKRGGIPIINPLTNEQPKENYFLFKITPQNLAPTIYNTSFYISHSYYQLNKAMNLPFKGIAFGLSNSYFVMDNIDQLTGWKWPKEISYGLRLDNEIGIGYGAYWSTFYTWIASDVTFPGTIIIVFIIGFLFSLALRDSLFSLNPLAVTAFCTLFYFIFHFAFNNPLQDGAGIMTCFVIPLLWLLFRKRNSSVDIQKANS
jgi:hypothetical protein